MAVGIERLAETVVARDAVLAQELAQLVERELDALAHVLDRVLVGRRRERDLERVGDREHLLDEAELARLGLALGVGDEALADVVELGGLAQRVVALCGESGLKLGDARLEWDDGLARGLGI